MQAGIRLPRTLWDIAINTKTIEICIKDIKISMTGYVEWALLQVNVSLSIGIESYTYKKLKKS